MLNRLVYFSERRCADDAVAAFIATAAPRNRAVNVTGLLMADETSFIQILEGPRGPVSAIFQDISRDPRHRGVTLVEMSEILQPTYPRWGMAYVADPAKIEDAWQRVMRRRVEPWALNVMQLRGLLKIAVGHAITAPATAPALATA